VKSAWSLTVLGGLLGIGTAVAYVRFTSATGVEGQTQTVPLNVDALRVAAWVDARLLYAAAQRTDSNETAPERPDADVETAGLREQRDHLYGALATHLNVDPKTVDQIANIVEQSPYIGTGNPEATAHPLTPSQCEARRRQARLQADDAAICGAPNMVAIFDPKSEDVLRSRVCIDQYEFPNIACEYPLVWVRASEALQICKVLGKRLCDAHEWEGACAGAVLPESEEYAFGLTREESTESHNRRRLRTWLGSLTPLLDVCGTMATKNVNCWDVTWEQCGSNTYPAGSFPDCVSSFGVYDMLGNVAEHMNLPLSAEQLASRSGLGQTEMKGSWFAYDGLVPHPDDCRWRAPAWHDTPIDSPSSHRNYQLGFRCCKDVP
jgi:formylglycine-generating enzyme